MNVNPSFLPGVVGMPQLPPHSMGLGLERRITIECSVDDEPGVPNSLQGVQARAHLSANRKGAVLGAMADRSCFAARSSPQKHSFHLPTTGHPPHGYPQFGRLAFWGLPTLVLQVEVCFA